MNLPDCNSTRDEARRAQAMNILTGKDITSDYPKAITQAGMGGKFTPDGKVISFPGNTFLCHIDPTSEFYEALCTVQDKLREHPKADHFTFLPRSSFHMTIFCGVSGAPLGSDGWPEGFPLDSSLDKITTAYDARLTGIDIPSEFSVLPENLFLPTSVSMRAATPQDETRLRDLRAKLEQLTGLYRGDVKSYVFHVSMAYVVKWLDERVAADTLKECESLFEEHLARCGPIRFNAIEFCSFNNMHKFHNIRSF